MRKREKNIHKKYKWIKCGKNMKRVFIYLEILKENKNDFFYNISNNFSVNWMFFFN